jgi:hypothetical protein
MQRAERNIICVNPALAATPVALVATLAHELCHELLIGSGLIEASHEAQESLTDLLAVLIGFGVFLANASLEFVRSQDGKRWQPVARGYLRQSVLCEALAQHAVLRGEGGAPPWAKALVGPVRWPVIVRLGQLRLTRNRRPLR